MTERFRYSRRSRKAWAKRRRPNSTSPSSKPPKVWKRLRSATRNWQSWESPQSGLKKSVMSLSKAYSGLPKRSGGTGGVAPQLVVVDDKPTVNLALDLSRFLRDF